MAALTVCPQVVCCGSRGRGGDVVASATMGMGAQNINTKTQSSTNQIFLTLSGRRKRCRVKVEAFWSANIERPSSVKMEAISGEEELDQLLDTARQSSQPIIIDWMAKWCRKCIYLKPKLEKLAAEFYPKIKFYYVDVNEVSQALVQRGGVSDEDGSGDILDGSRYQINSSNKFANFQAVETFLVGYHIKLIPQINNLQSMGQFCCKQVEAKWSEPIFAVYQNI